MNRNISLLSVVLMAFLAFLDFTSPAHAEKTDDAYKRAAAFSAEGKYGEALPLARKALTEAEKQHDTESIKLTQPLTLLANIYQKTGSGRTRSRTGSCSATSRRAKRSASPRDIPRRS